MIWVSFGLLGLYALLLLSLAGAARKGDAAGRGLALGIFAAAAIVWLLLAGLAALGAWLGSRVLLAAPFAPLALLIGPPALRWTRRLRSTMPTPALRRLEEAAREGRADRAQALLEAGVKIEPEIGRALLHAALDGRYARDVVPLLINAGAEFRDPALLAKALTSSTTELRPFLAGGLSPDYVFPDGDRLLHKALDRGWSHDVLALLDAGADVNAPDRDGWPPLLAHATGRRGFGPGNWTGVEDLLKRGADPKAVAPDGATLAALFAKTTPYEMPDERRAALRARLE